MPITDVQNREAQSYQHEAAHDENRLVRVVAGPGTGKSRTIVERVKWLLEQGIAAERIHVVSFTRAASRDLRERVHKYCRENGQPDGSRVSVTTLHSLALRVLRIAGFLQAYPADPLVLDRWEQKHIFDREFSLTSGKTPTRCKEIRLNHEAFWSTNDWEPPNYIPPNPSVTETEREQFARFHEPRSQLYSCVLPGEILRMCVRNIQSGTLVAVNLLAIEHLIVDEYQDLNPNDIIFIDSLAASGVSVFVAGDDDQSIYSFRYASPTGIQSFTTRYPTSGDHTLARCFRCTPKVLSLTISLIRQYTLPNRIEKSLTSLYEGSSPPVEGQVFSIRFRNAGLEARSIANSCKDLIQAGVQPNEILILLSDTRILGSAIETALDEMRVSYTPAKANSLIKDDAGRFLFCIVRLLCNRNDYIAHRSLLALQPGTGLQTCNEIAENALANNLNYCDLFYNPIPQGVFTRRQTRAIDDIRTIISEVRTWQSTDNISDRSEQLKELLSRWCGSNGTDLWDSLVNRLPDGLYIQELRDYLAADTDERQAGVLEIAYDRLGLEIPEQGFLPQSVRIMTMHNSKGLNAQVVFIPGLEEEAMPGVWRRPYPGLILEGARLLYVSITRARAACVLSYSDRRTIYGRYRNTTPSRYAHLTGLTFIERSRGLTRDEVETIFDDIQCL